MFNMQRPKFISGEVYHIYNRGVEKRVIFSEDKDRFRFVHDIFEFNDLAPAINLNFHLQSSPTVLCAIRKLREILVEILCFCLMPNHYHLLVRQKVDGGITEFMRKLGTGYTNYFNKKYQRVGPLFQGKFKAIHVEKEAHLRYLPHYIHLNPLDLTMPEWREQRLTNTKKAVQFLSSYRWSSYLDYINKKNFPSVTHRSPLLKLYGGPTSYEKEMKEWLAELNLEQIKDIILE